MSNRNSWTQFLDRYYHEDILTLAHEYPDRRSLYVNFIDIEKFNPDLVDELLQSPIETLEALEDAVRNFSIPIDKKIDNVHVRLVQVPNLVRIRQIRSAHVGQLIAIEGLVRIIADVRPEIRVAAFECGGCGEIMHVKQVHDKFSEPYCCDNASCARKGSFKLLRNESEFVDAHRIRVQESPEDLIGGEQVQTLDILLEDDTAGITSPGNHVTITGVLRSYQRVTQYGKSTTFDIILDANSVEVHDREFTEVEITPEEEEEIRALAQDPDIYDKIIQSIAPSIHGYDNVKEGLALQILGGVRKHAADGSRTRGDIHVLLVGDPGVAKSQLLRYMTRLSPLGISTVGYSSSGVGLTAAAVRNEFGDGRWALEAGALVLADRGLIAIDELDKMDPEDRQALHEAAEQQTVTISKAGIQTTLQARCTILAAANPKYSRFDPYEGISSQIAMPSTLLSRFDLIYIMKDKPDIEQDRAIFQHIFGYRSQNQEPKILPELLRKYVAYAKSNVHPIAIDSDAQKAIEDFYLELRGQGTADDAPVPVTARQIEALERLCAASARMRLCDRITLEDAQRAIRVTASCLRKVAYDDQTGLFDIDRIEGVSKSQRDTIKLLREIICNIVSERGNAAPKSDIAAEAVARGISPEKIDGLLRDLLREGELLMEGGGYRVL